MSMVNILVFAGSLRKESYNKKLARVAAKSAEAAGAKVTLVELNDYSMPIFSEDIEASEGPNQKVTEFKELMKNADAFFICSSEYNSSISGVLKNTIDWASRQADGEKPLEAFNGKVVALMSASPGNLGGLRGLVHLRSILGNIKMLVLPDQLAISQAHEAFGPDGSLLDQGKQKAVANIANRLVEVAGKLKE